jgi:hypothetical protein
LSDDKPIPIAGPAEDESDEFDRYLAVAIHELAADGSLAPVLAGLSRKLANRCLDGAFPAVDETDLAPGLTDWDDKTMEQVMADFAARLQARGIPLPENWPVAPPAAAVTDAASAAVSAAEATAATTAAAASRSGPLRKIWAPIAAVLIFALLLAAVGSFMPQTASAWQKKFMALITGQDSASVILKEVQPLEPGIYEMGSYEAVNQYVPFDLIYPYDKLPQGYEEKQLTLERTADGNYKSKWLFAQKDGTYIQLEQRNTDLDAWKLNLSDSAVQKIDLGAGRIGFVQDMELFDLAWLDEENIIIQSDMGVEQLIAFMQALIS